MSLEPYLEGLGLGASLIIAIGAQNAFVLRQGLRRRHVFITALICFLCDAILIASGVAGLGAPLFRRPATWQLLDVFVGAVMWLIAAGLARSGLS